jgi:hypothetical protein
MDWMNALDDLVQRYSGQGDGTAPATEDPHQDFQRVSRTAPQKVVASGISQAFRSEQTPPFPQMVASLFTHSDPNQRAGLLNRLLASVPPGVLSGTPGLGSLSSLMGKSAVMPEQVSPEQVQQIAAHAERQNPSVVDEVSSYYAQHPEVMKAIGGLALRIALRHMLRG